MQTTRTFVALPLGAEQVQATCDLIAELRQLTGGFRWVAAEHLHWTLVFLGNVVNEQIADVCKLVAEAATAIAPFEVGLSGVGAFPNMHRPRTLWIGCGSGHSELTQLHDLVDAVLEPLGFRREQRAFVPHLTIARNQKHGPAPRSLAPMFARFEKWDGGVTLVREALIFGSELTRDGPQHTILGRAPLA